MPVVSTAAETSTVSGGVGGGVGFGPTVSVSGGEPALPPPPPVVFGVVVCVDEVGLGTVGENLLFSRGAVLMMPLARNG